MILYIVIQIWAEKLREILGEHFLAKRGDIQRVDGVVRRIASGAEKDLLPIGTPARGLFAAGMPGELARGAAGGGHSEDVPVAVAPAGEGDPLPVG